MAEPVFHGICANCIHARTCRYSLNAARPVHFCDHYEVNGRAPAHGPSNAEQPGPGHAQNGGQVPREASSEPAGQKAGHKAAGEPSAGAPHRRASDGNGGLNSPAAVARRREGSGAGASPRFRGLCVDCVKRFDCEMAGTESGVWRCREYQGPADEDA